jgi:subtilase family serine protease
MQGICSRLAGICLFSASIVILGQSGHAQTVQNRIAQPIVASKVTPLQGTVHPLVQAQYDQGPVSSSMQLQGMTLNFNRSAAQQASLSALLTAQQSPSSSSYHQWLTAAQFGAQFGMSQQDLDQVTAWLQSQGFTVDKVAESRTSIRFSGSVGLAEQALHTQIHKYIVNGESHFANATQISLPSAFASTVSRVGGLQDFKPKPRLVRPAGTKTDSAQPHFTSGISGDHFLAPGDFAVIYDVNPLYTAGYTGSGQTIGIMGQTDIVMADITDFRSAAGLPANNPTVFLIPGSADPGIGDASGDINEADLDLEWSGGVAKNASIVFVNSTNVMDSMQYAIENKINGLQIPILSISYGGCEPSWTSADLSSLEASFQQANAQGQTVFSAAGDNGAADCDVQSNPNAAPIVSATQGLQVDYPASSAYVTGMGGNEFTGDGTAASPSTGADQYWSANGSNDALTSALSYIPEMIWNDTAFEIENGGGFSAGGGGKSLLWSKPSWQTGVTGIPTDSARDVPDLSLNGSADHDPYLVCTQIILDSDPTGSNYTSSCTNGFRISDSGYSDDQGLVAYGGTSADAPSFAGILALIEQKLGVPQGLGNVNPTLYTLAANSTTYASAFHDITTGNNIVPCTAGSTNCPSSGEMGYSAGTGYDQASGLGSVDASNLATAFGSVAAKGGTTTSLAVSPSSPSVGTTVTLTATVAPSSGTTAPTGTVTFTIDGAAGSPVTLTNGVATTTTSFSTGGAHTVVAAYSGDTNFYVSTSATTTINIGASGGAATTTTLAASPTTVALDGALTLTATVQSSTAGTVAGTVTFAIGGTTVGTAPVTAGASGTGTATLAVSSATTALGFTAGSDTITAAYGGDSIYAASSGTAAITVTNPGITMTVGNMTIPSASAGNSASSTITITSTQGYTGTVNLTASAPSLNAGYSLGATSLAISGGGTASTTITIQTLAASLQKGAQGNSQGTTNRLIVGAGAAGFGVFFLLGIPGFRKRRWPAATSLLLLGLLGTMMGCGSSTSGAATAGAYTVTVTATDSSNNTITTSAAFTVTIK